MTQYCMNAPEVERKERKWWTTIKQRTDNVTRRCHERSLDEILNFDDACLVLSLHKTTRQKDERHCRFGQSNIEWNESQDGSTPPSQKNRV